MVFSEREKAVALGIAVPDEVIVERKPLTAKQCIKWIENHFYLYDTGELAKLHDVQVAIIEEAFKRDDQGLLAYSTVIVSMIKKSAKSTLIAMIVDYWMQHTPYAQAKLIANDLKQADSRVGHYLREAIRIGKTNDDAERDGVVIKPSGYRISYPNGAVVEMIPIDPRGEAGGNDDLLVYSELWGWKNKAHTDMWAEMTLSPTKFGQSQRWIDTYAGYTDGGSPILEELYSVIAADDVRERTLISAKYELYADADARMLCAWVTKRHFPWQIPAYYREQRKTLVPEQYERMHENKWVSDVKQFVPMEWWDSGQVTAEVLGQMTPYRELIISLDAGTDSDCFAMVAVTRALLDASAFDDDDMEERDVVEVRYAQAWYPENYAQFTFKEPKDEIRRLCRLYNVLQICYDAYQLKELADTLTDEGVGWFEPFSQAGPRATADKMLYDRIRQRRIRHQGEVELRNHIKNANRKDDGSKIRLVKRNDKLKIDLAVALSMAASRARDWIPV